MKRLILILTLLSAVPAASAQSELLTDSIRRLPSANYKEYGGFLLDMGLMNVLPLRLSTADAKLFNAGKDYNELLRLNPDATYTQGLSTIFSPSFSTFGTTGSASSEQLQMGSFRLKNGIRANTYGDYKADGTRVPNRSALPWERNNFRGAFELKSANGSFGIRLEVQQGRATFPY